MIARQFLLLIFCVQFVGCGSGAPGGESSPPPDIPPGPIGQLPSTTSRYVHFEGIWQGTATPDDGSTTTRAIMLVNGWGEIRVLLDDAQLIGWGQRTATEFEATLTGIKMAGETWSDGSRNTSFEYTGTFDENTSIEAVYSGDSDGGDLQIHRVTDAESSFLDAAYGTWALFDENLNIAATFNIEAFYRISGSHSNGCVFLGEIDDWSSHLSYDIYEIEVSGCPLADGIDVNGTYVGTAAIFDVADDGTDESGLIIALSNDENQLTYLLYRP